MRTCGELEMQAQAEPSSPTRHDSIKQTTEHITAQPKSQPTKAASLNAEGFVCAVGLDLSCLCVAGNRTIERDDMCFNALGACAIANNMRCSNERKQFHCAHGPGVFALLKLLLFVYDSPG
jgi:hypothetical protein